MRDSRILLLIVIMVLGVLSQEDKEGPREKRLKQTMCLKDCIRIIKQDLDTIKSLSGIKFCIGINELLSCWKLNCLKKNEKDALHQVQALYRNAFKEYYPDQTCAPEVEPTPCLTECIRKFKENPDTFTETIRGEKYCKGMSEYLACWKDTCIKKGSKPLINQSVRVYQDIFKVVNCDL